MIGIDFRGHTSVVMQQALATAIPLKPTPLAHAGADEGRLRAAFDAHFDLVWRYLRRLGLNDADADDGTQQTFMIFSRKIDDVLVGKERAFLCSIALRVAADMRKRAWRRYEQAADNADEEAERESLNPEALTTQKAARVLLDAVLEQLPMDLRAVFVLFEIEEMSTQQIAGALELPVGTVASRLRRAREKFRALVARMSQRDAAAGGGS